MMIIGRQLCMKGKYMKARTEPLEIIKEHEQDVEGTKVCTEVILRLKEKDENCIPRFSKFTGTGSQNRRILSGPRIITTLEEKVATPEKSTERYSYQMRNSQVNRSQRKEKRKEGGETVNEITVKGDHMRLLHNCIKTKQPCLLHINQTTYHPKAYTKKMKKTGV